MGNERKAVFLSYARDDAAAARRIAEALRASGLEVWFDENELRGGDAWDQKIRRQINDCTLFIAVISEHTEARAKGYFRLEWKLAVEQMHMLLEGVPFVVPVVVDDTPESAAAVPPEFLRVQWTRLPGALPTPQFVEQIKHLLTHAPTAGITAPPMAMRPSPSPLPVPHVSRRRVPLAWKSGGVLVIGIVAAAIVVFRSAERKGVEPGQPASASAPKPISAAAPAPAGKSIAVLPFGNLSTDKENEFFAEGLQEEVITALTKIHDLKVISRTSVAAYKDPAARNLKQIAADVGVAAILQGTVQRAGTKVHLNVQLIDARTDEHLWAETYTRDLTDIFSVEAELAEAVTGALKSTFLPAERSLIAQKPTESQEAYDLYLRSRTMFRYGSDHAAANEAIALCEEAVKRDPKFALAFAQLATENCEVYWDGNWDPTPERLERARVAVEAAMRLAPNLPEVHVALGEFYYRIRRDWNQALSELRIAEVGLPSDPALLLMRGFVERRLGHWQAAIDYFGRAELADPFNVAAAAGRAELLALLPRFPAVCEETEAAIARVKQQDGRLRALRDEARYEIDGDRPAFFRALDALDHGDGAYHAEMLKGNYDAAERELADPRHAVVPVFNNDSAIASPAALYRAEIAFIRGRHADAVRWADETIAYYRTKRWAPRQEVWVMMGTAQANAFAGRATEAIEGARNSLAMEEGHDLLTATLLRGELGRIYALLDRSEDALAVLRTLMTGPSRWSPRLTRDDPLWSRLKNDPRFEQILNSAKPL